MIEKELENNICQTCWDIVYGPNRTKGAEFFNINHGVFCSLSCYYEFEKETEERKSRQRNKKSRKSSKKKSKQKKKQRR